MINQIFIKSLAIIVAIYASIWIFNHVDPWIGIGSFVLLLYISIKKFSKL